MKQIKLVLCTALLLSNALQPDFQATNPTIDQQTFMYTTKRSEVEKLPLSDIEKKIIEHISRRKIDNWIFFDTKVHSATLQAIHAYKKLTPEDQKNITPLMQTILDSHAYFLYHPLYWKTLKHIKLVDSFIYSITGERININQLDNIATPISITHPGPIVYPIVYSTSSSHKKSNSK